MKTRDWADDQADELIDDVLRYGVHGDHLRGIIAAKLRLVQAEGECNGVRYSLKSTKDLRQ